MIIFEGTDGAGKSTLAQACAQLMLAKGKLTLFKGYGVLPPWWDYLEHYLHDIKPGAVLDRFTASEAVYGPLFRGKINDKFTELNRAVVARELHRVGCVTVYVNPSQKSIRERIEKRGDKLFKIEQICEAHRYFENVMLPPQQIAEIFDKGTSFINKWDSTNTIYLDSTTIPDRHLQAEEFNRLVHAIVERSEIFEEHQQLFHIHHKIDASGTLHQPQAIFFGEMQNQELNPPNRAFSAGQSSVFMHHLMLKAGLDPNRVLMINVNQRGGELEHFVTRLIREQTVGYPFIALGQVAHQYLERVGIVHCTMEHPSYLRRFKSGDPAYAVDALKGCLEDAHTQ